MNVSSLRLSLIAGLALPLGLATAAYAQPADAPPPPPGAEAGMRHHRDPAEMRARMSEHLRSVLQLQPSQGAALDAYLDALRPPRGERGHTDGERGRDEMQHLTTPERLDRMAARLDERRARMLGVIAATRQFYAQLSPAQQKAFDDLAPMMMGHMGHEMGGRGAEGHGADDGMGPGGSPRG